MWLILIGFLFLSLGGRKEEMGVGIKYAEDTHTFPTLNFLFIGGPA